MVMLLPFPRFSYHARCLYFTAQAKLDKMKRKVSSTVEVAELEEENKALHKVGS